MFPRRTTTPTEPLTLAEALTHLRETGDGGANDEYIEVIITAAREACESRTERTLTTTGWLLQLDGFPSVTGENPHAAIYLYQPPIIAVQWPGNNKTTLHNHCHVLVPSPGAQAVQTKYGHLVKVPPLQPSRHS